MSLFHPSNSNIGVTIKTFISFHEENIAHFHSWGILLERFIVRITSTEVWITSAPGFPPYFEVFGALSTVEDRREDEIRYDRPCWTQDWVENRHSEFQQEHRII